ncbi:ATP-binding protein [Pedobacter alpinus]|uniref:ATP-binding protein n=1 Tax=Pedobacter alpinus TaxID=1590643 RepID=A0ABW5TMJ8_9SPHI
MKLLFSILLLSFTITSNAQLKLNKLWETKDLATPESVLPIGNLLYVSLIDGDGAKADGKGGIAILSEDGTIISKDWVTCLNAPKGMGVYKGKLYVADINEVVKIDIKSARVEAKIQIGGSVFLNDIAINKQGEVFVSDTRLAKVHQIKNDIPNLYLDSIKSANGLKFINNELHILSGPALIKVDKNKQIQTIAKGLAAGGDGLEPYANGDFLATCWVGLIYHIKKDGTFTLLMDTRADKINTADIGFNPKSNILYVPTFNKNSVVAYKVQ